MQRSSVIRLLVSIFVCFSVLFYNFTGLIKPVKAVENNFLIPANDSVSRVKEKSQETQKNETESKEEITSQPENISSQSVTSLPVSAEDVVGKIIERYNSPYTAGSSYNKVYIKNSTGVNIDIKGLTESALGFKIGADGTTPEVLIVHTHATESFMETDADYYTSSFKSRSQENEKNMVKIGAIVAQKLNDAGIKTLHDVTLHDYPEYNGSYTRSAKTIKSYLSKYPTIKVVLDLHRDAVASGQNDKVKLVTEIEGKKAAQVMLVMGSNTGGITSFPNWQENLKLAFKLQQKLEEKYPTLARPLLLRSRIYNQNLTTGSLLLEFGTDANSFDEVWYSAELVGNALTDVLKE